MQRSIPMSDILIIVRSIWKLNPDHEFTPQMYVYNLTTCVEHSIHNEWLQWQKDQHIPAIMASGQFTEYRFFRLLEQDESTGITYVMQFVAPTAAHYIKYTEDFAPFFQRQKQVKWGNRLVDFPTVMEVMH